MKIYMAVTADKYELPIAVFDTVLLLCRWSGRSKSALYSALKRASVDQKLKCRYVRVEVNDETDL